MPRRIIKIHRVPVDVAIQIPALRIGRVRDHVIRLHEFRYLGTQYSYLILPFSFCPAFHAAMSDPIGFQDGR